MHTQIKNAFAKLNGEYFQNVNFEINPISENEVEIKTSQIDKPWEDVQVYGDLVSETTITAKITKNNNTFTINGEAIEKVLIDQCDKKVLDEYENDGIDLTQPEIFKFKTTNENLEMLIQITIFEKGYKS
jgi:hypothetical protein